MKVGIVMGSDSDFPIMKKALAVLDEFGVTYEVLLASAHRTPQKIHDFASTAENRGLSCIIAGAGAAAHLPGVIASFTTLPVIGVPINATCLKGMDALLAIVQMPSGMPVATMAIDGAKNAALFAIQLGAVTEQVLNEKMKTYRLDMANAVEEKNKKLQETLGGM